MILTEVKKLIQASDGNAVEEPFLDQPMYVGRCMPFTKLTSLADQKSTRCLRKS